MTINIPNSVLKRIGLGLLTLLAAIGVIGIVSAVSHKSQNNSETSNTPQEQPEMYLGSSTSSEPSRATTPAPPAPQENPQSFSTPRQSSPVSDNQSVSLDDLVTKKLYPADVEIIKNSFSLFSAYDSYVASSNIEACTNGEGKLTVEGVWQVSDITRLPVVSYPNSIIAAVGDLENILSNANELYWRSCQLLQGDNSTSGQLLSQARDKISQAEAKYASIPK